jgi:hypothetical protein
LRQCADGGLSEIEDVRSRQLEALGVQSEPINRAFGYWQIKLDPYELERIRQRQKLQLGRYAKQPIPQWDGVPLTEFLGYHAELVRMVEEENSRTS